MRLAIVVPCFNEQDVLPVSATRLAAVLQKLQDSRKVAADSQIWLVDDGSLDRTWTIISDLARNSPRFRGIKLSRNRGHQNALLAGLLTAEGDAIVSVDADLQDDLQAIEQMVDAFLSGSEVVYGVRSSRATDTLFKRGTAQSYYRILKAFGVDVVYNHADFRLLGRRAVEALREFSEVNLFLRGVVPLLGYPTGVQEVSALDLAIRNAVDD